MSLPDELAKLNDLFKRGALSEAEFVRAKARVIDRDALGRSAEGGAAINGLQRSRSDRWLGGVCGGLADALGIAAWIWRLAFLFAVICGGTGIAVYALLWIFVPNEADPFAERPRQLA